MTEPPRSAEPPAPEAARLAALPSDAWAWLLPHVRSALQELDTDEVTATVQRLRTAPTSRLAGGRVRRELDELLTRGGPLWRSVAERVRAADDAPAEVVALLRTASPPPQRSHPAPRAAAGVAARTRADARARERLREVRAERDELRRQLDGAAARAAAAEADQARLEAQLADVRGQLARLRTQLEAAATTEERALARERRRRDAEVRDLQATVTALRRADAERSAARRRREDAAAQEAARERTEETRRRAERRAAAVPTRLVPGRPSRFPADVVAGTTEAAELLLHAGRLVLVDGYNVTKQHRPDLDLEGQRAWLVRTLATLAARRRVRPTVVFDGERAAGIRPPGGSREVTVVFTSSSVTADDELVLAVEATDEPVVVVTDDRELTDRLRASGADVLGTRSLLDATRRV